MDALDAIAKASLVVKLVLTCLVGMSIISWLIIYRKRRQLNTIAEANDAFLAQFWRATSLDSIHERLKDFPFSNVARVFRAGYVELQKIADSEIGKNKPVSDGSTSPRLQGLDNLERALRKAYQNEVTFLEQNLSFLATTGSTGPFIGLFGTVWGIMGAFQKIGNTKSASLAIVAPGIAEALIATAIGLAAAIPAVIAYNYFLAHLRKEEVNLSNFTVDFLNIAKRNFFRDH